MFDKIFNYFEDFEQKYKFSIRPAAVILTFLIFWLIHAGRASFGDTLPNPINVFNHIGNVDSVIPALIAGYAVGFLSTRTLRINKKQILTLSVVAGTLVGLVCNVLIELPWGMYLLKESNVSDPLDVVWGTTFCLVACLTCFRVKPKK